MSSYVNQTPASTAEVAVNNLRRAGLGDVVHTPGQEAYGARTASYWARPARLEPWAIVQPRNTKEVSNAVRALVETPGCKFAVRSGGHMVWPGACGIQDGVTIDLGLMTGTTYDPETKLASLLPGGTWTDVYAEIEKHGRMVAGVREDSVGIGGFLTGGGKTFYTCKVVNYEIVLADGSIVAANASENADLFRVLKGGGNNFGIVTRFDMATFPSKDIWDARIVCGEESTREIVEALADFVKNLGEQPHTHTLTMWTYLPKTKDHFIMIMLTSLEGDQEAASNENFLAIPGQKHMEAKMTTIATKLAASPMPKAREQTWFTLTFKNDTRIIQKAADIFEASVELLKARIPDQDFYYSMVQQPLPASVSRHSTARGGNMFGLDCVEADCVLLIWAVEVETAVLRTEVVFPALQGAVAKIEAFAASVGGNVDFRYLNYCDGSQDPLGSYGEENIKKMREAAEKYDPEGVFQHRVPGGFKIPKLEANIRHRG